MMGGHKVYSIRFSVHKKIVKFVAHDETEFVGYEDNPTEMVWTIVAPTKQLALKAFVDAHVAEFRVPEYKIKYLRVDEVPVDLFLVAWTG